MKVSTLSLVITKRALRFTLSGLLVTGLHVLVATVLIEYILPVPSLANGVAFLVATVFSYLVNTIWSFSTPLHGKNLIRFCIVSLLGLSLAMSVSGVAQYLGLYYLYGIFLVAIVIPPITFILHNFWTYR